MSFPTAALSGGQLNTLRNSTNATPAWFGNQYISTDANTVVFACQVAAVADTTSFIQFVFGTVSSGSAAAVRVDMTVFISRTNDIRKAYFVGRVHTPGATGTSTGTLYINETSIDLLIGDYVWVVDDYRIWPKLGRDVDGTFYTDYNIAFRQLLPHVKGLKRAYASWVTDGYYQIAFNITATAAASGASISSYLWEVGDGTFVVGNSASQNPTVKWPPGERYIHLTITDSGGRTLTRHVKIFAHHRTLYPPNLGFNGALIQGDVTSGYNATVNAFTGVSDLLDNTLIVVWTDEWYANTEGSLIDNVNFVGRFRSEANQAQVDPDYAILSEVNWTCEGTAAQMAREHNALVTTIDTASPAAFGEITNLTPWRAMWYFLTEFSTVANLHDVLIPDTSTTYRCLGLTTQGQSMLDVVNDIGQSINTALEFAPDGTTQFARDLRYESSSARGSALNVAGWTNQDFTGEMSIAVDPIQNTGRIDASGGAFDTAATQVTEFLSVWPGMAQNYPDGQATLARQILAATSNAAAASFELSTRAGRLGGITNPVDILSTQHPDGYGASFLVPSHAYYWNWTLSAADCNIRDRSYSTSDKWFLTNVSIAHDNATATREVRATYQRDIDIDGFATPGQAIIYPPQNDTPISIPDIPPFPAFDTIPEVPDWFDPSIASIDDEIPVPNLVGGSTNPFTHPNPPRNGNTLLFGSATQAWVSQNLLIAKKPKYVEVTPTGITAIQMGLLDQRAGKTGAWLLDYDSGTDQSWVWYTANVYAARPEWSQGATLNAKYTVLRQTSTGIAVYSPAAPAPSTYTLAYQGDSGTTGLTVTSTGPNTWHVSAAYYNAALERYFIELYFLNGAARYCTVKWTITNMTGWSNANFSLTNNGSVDEDGICGTRHAAPDGLAPGNGWQQWYDSQGYSAGDIGMLDIRSRSAFEFDISVVIPAATAARVVYSADNGETYSANSSVGTSPGSVGGFDVVRSGGTAIAAADAQAYKATSIGGAYSSLGSDGATSGSQPILLIIPYYQWGSTTTKNYPSSTPDYLLGSAALVSSEALWKVTGAGGRTAITNTISGNKAIPVGPNAATMIYGTKLAYLGTAGGNRYLSVSTNSGTSWTSVAVGSSAVFCRVRRGSTSQLYVADDTAIKYSKSFNTTLVSITTPGSALTWLDILG